MNFAKIAGKAFEFGILALGLFLFVMLVMFLNGCSHCEPQVIYKTQYVDVPVAVYPDPLPLPDLPTCQPPEENDDVWRASAQFIKDCFDTLLKSIEDHRHVIESFNNSLTTDNK